MDFLLKSYSAKNHRVVIGAHVVTGPAEDFLTIEPVGDGDQSAVGAYGDVVRSVSNDPRVRVTLRLQYGSATNAVLAALKKTDQITGGQGTFPIMVTDLTGAVPVLTGEAWIVNRPSSNYAVEASEREWTLECVGEYIPV